MTKPQKIEGGELTPIQVEMLKQMLEWDTEYRYPYSEFYDLPEVKTLKKEMRGLVAKGYVKISRGGVDDDDGHVIGGTGFYLDYELIPDIRKDVEHL
jgi:hypothetical protein